MLKNEISEKFSALNQVIKVTRQEVEKGLELHRRSIVCDSLCRDPEIISVKLSNVISEMLDAGKPLHEIRSKINKLRNDELLYDTQTKTEYVEYWRRSGVTCISKTLSSDDIQSALNAIAFENLKFDKLRDVVSRATRAEDIKRAKQDGKHAILWNHQNTMLIEQRNMGLETLDFLYGLGVRIIQLTYNLRNLAGDGCTERYQSGLSNFGLKIIERMNKLGILIDASHCGIQTTFDAIEASNKPIAFTHTGCKTVFNHPRCKNDEQIQALAEKGGYIGIFTLPFFLGYPAREKGTLKALLDHIDHAVEIAGVDHVGIGTDTGVESRRSKRLAELSTEEINKVDFVPHRFWRGWKPEHNIDVGLDPIPDNWAQSWVNWPNITIGLASRGYSNTEIQGIIGGNFLNILERVIG